MATSRRKPATSADIEALPPHMVGEIAYGVLHTHPRPAPRRSLAATELQGELFSPFRRVRGGPGGWVFHVEPELHLGDHTLVPDIASWRQERMPRLPETAFFELAPDWLCEVLSPSTQRFDRTDKLALYAEFGVKHCWYVDPDARTLEVFELTGGKWLIAATFKDADIVTAPPFEAHSFGLDVLWAPGEMGV